MGPDLKAIYRFDCFTLDLVRGTLFAADGSELTLRPKSFAMLRHMVMHAGRLMDRDELMQAVWPGVFVTDDSIAQCVRDIRRALGDQTQRVLRTVPRRGYLLDVSATATCVTPGEAIMPSPVTTASDAVPPLPMPGTNRPVLMVLPFETIGEDPGQSCLADGIADDLVTDLTHFHDLCVVKGRASPAAETSGFPVPETVAYVFTGSLRRSGGRIRVTVRLNDARSGVNIWAERFDRPLAELSALQEELVEHLPNYLVTQIELDAIRRARRRTASVDAYELCLQGRELHTRATEADTLRARELFARAIELDPNYAKAYAWQAYTVQRGFTHLWGEPRGRAAAVEALALAQRSVELDPDSSFCLGRLAFVLLLNQAWDQALATARAGVRANPSAAGSRYFYGAALTHAGDPIEAEREIRLALLLDPFHPLGWRASLGRALWVDGRPEEALAELRFCATQMPGYTPCLHTLATAATEAGEIEEARAAVRGLLRMNPGLTVRSAADCLFFRDPALTERFRAGFRAGGMPEG
jgi:TolB-like protein